MLTIRVDDAEAFDENTSTFVKREGFVLELEHSLVSLSKWESFWEKPFLSSDQKTTEETIDYIRCMIVGGNPPEDFDKHLSAEHFEQINKYITASMTATTFSEIPGRGSKQTSEYITSELIYYWMISHQVPFECERWHLKRLLTLLEVCSRKNEKPKKKSKAEIAAQYRDLNAQRKSKLGTTG